MALCETACKQASEASSKTQADPSMSNVGLGSQSQLMRGLHQSVHLAAWYIHELTAEICQALHIATRSQKAEANSKQLRVHLLQLSTEPCLVSGMIQLKPVQWLQQSSGPPQCVSNG